MYKQFLLGLSLAILVACNEKTPEANKQPVTNDQSASTSQTSAVVSQNLVVSQEAPEPEIPVDESSIFKAIESEDVSLLKAAIAKGLDVNAPCRVSDEGNSCLTEGHKNVCTGENGEKVTEIFYPIFLAMVKGNFEIVKTLLDAGASMDSTSNECRYVCEMGDGCFDSMVEQTPYYKMFNPGRADTLPAVYSDSRIQISMYLEKDKEFMAFVNASDFVRAKNVSEDVLIDYFKMAKSKNSLAFNDYTMEYVTENGEERLVFKTSLQYAEEAGKVKVAEYLKTLGARKVLKFEPYTLSEKDGTIAEESICEDVHKIFYDDGTTAFSIDECGT